ncbi:hypothetical protein [Methylobacterium tarhaniae]|uniref:hypothetical protein n=1 Tax=Methylobacterium tarhaniae TaxID=1187852 RepID=UPI0012EDD3DA|nr:hypothetical protein [Methylobacterium tarhaniae]
MQRATLHEDGAARAGGDAPSAFRRYDRKIWIDDVRRKALTLSGAASIQRQP